MNIIKTEDSPGDYPKCNLVRDLYAYQDFLSLQKDFYMKAVEIKIDLFRKIDSLKGKRLQEAYGMLLNYLNGKDEIDEWKSLTKEQQSALHHGVGQLDKGLGRNHEKVMSDKRNRFTND